MSIDIREAKQLNQKKKSDLLDEILGRLDVIEGKVDNLASEKRSKIDETIRDVKSSVYKIEDNIYTSADKHMKQILLRVFQISGAIILCAGSHCNDLVDNIALSSIIFIRKGWLYEENSSSKLLSYL
mgnify:CR=1 FL=1